MSHRGAALAELPQFDQSSPHFGVPLQANGESYPALQVVGGAEFDQPAGQAEIPQLVDADTIPELKAIRDEAYKKSLAIKEKNMQHLRDGEFDVVPMPVDPLGTARHAHNIKIKYGANSPEYKEAYEGLVLDNERLIGEAWRSLTWEYFEPAPQKQNPVTGKFESHGLVVEDMTERGISPILSEKEDLARRLNDHVGEITHNAIPLIHALGKLGLQETVRERHISECPTFAIEGHKKDSKAAHGGYVPAIEKFMVGDMEFNKTAERFQEQVGLSGKFITHDVIMTVLARRGAVKAGQQMDKTELHSKRFFDKSGADDLFCFVADLDAEASEVSGKIIFMGEEVDASHPRDYSTIKPEAELRKQKLAPKPQELADYQLTLVENKTDRWASEKLIDNFLDNMLHEIAKYDHEMAETAFDKATAEGYALAAELEAEGRLKEAEILRAEVREAAPDASYCGAGSCGLEGVSDFSADAVKARSLGLRGRGLLKDKERACPSCKKKDIMYDMSGNKACTGCSLTQIDGNIKKAEKPKDNKENAVVISLAEKRNAKTAKQASKTQPKDL